MENKWKISLVATSDLIKCLLLNEAKRKWQNSNRDIGGEFLEVNLSNISSLLSSVFSDQKVNRGAAGADSYIWRHFLHGWEEM